MREITEEQIERIRRGIQLTPEEVRALGLDPHFTWRNFNGWLVPVNAERCVGPYVLALLSQQTKSKLPPNIVVTGRTGIGKTYLAVDIARGLDPKFTIDQVVFTFSEYIELVRKLPMYRPIVFDEPSYAMSHRDWYNQLNKVLMKTMESQRFKVHPVLIPVVNKALLDKTIRRYLIHYQIIVLDRGVACLYHISPSQFTDKIYYRRIARLYYFLNDWLKCPRDSCLGCPRLWKKNSKGEYVCNIFRAQYERKKASIQEERYSEAAEFAAAMEKKAAVISDRDILKRIRENSKAKEAILGHRMKSGRLDTDVFRIVLEEELGLKITDARARRIEKLWRYRYPEDFSQ